MSSRKKSVEPSEPVEAPEIVELDERRLLAPVLGANRDGTASVDTSRGLLLTVLGEYLLPHGRSAWTQTLIDAMALVGVKDKSARQAIARIHARGWLERRRVGRQTRWTLTDEAVTMLDVGATRIYGFGQNPRTWTGTWSVLLASVPESDRHLRHRMAAELSWAGFGSLGQGIWLSPWPETEDAAVAVFEDLGVDATSFRGELGRLGSGARLAGQAWDLPGLRAEYDAFLANTENPAARPAGRASDRGQDRDEDAARSLIELVHRWRRFPFLDPELPPELLPADWPGPEAAARFAELRLALVDRAQGWWLETESRYTPASARS